MPNWPVRSGHCSAVAGSSPPVPPESARRRWPARCQPADPVDASCRRSWRPATGAGQGEHAVDPGHRGEPADPVRGVGPLRPSEQPGRRHCRPRCGTSRTRTASAPATGFGRPAPEVDVGRVRGRILPSRRTGATPLAQARAAGIRARAGGRAAALVQAAEQQAALGLLGHAAELATLRWRGQVEPRKPAAADHTRDRHAAPYSGPARPASGRPTWEPDRARVGDRAVRGHGAVGQADRRVARSVRPHGGEPPGFGVPQARHRQPPRPHRRLP